MLLANWLRDLQQKIHGLRASRRRAGRERLQVGIEALEFRVLLSAGDISLKNTGKLIITGTPDGDVAEVSYVDVDTLRVYMQTADTIHDETFNRSDVNMLVFYGNQGDDTFTNNTDLDSNAFGADGNDELTGGGGNDLLKGQTGDDILDGRGGKDTLKGFAGRDTLYGRDGNDLLVAGGGRDMLDGGRGSDVVKGQGGNLDTAIGGEGNDTVDGGSGDDILTGGPGDDWIRGRTGDDILVEAADVDFTLTDNRLTGLGDDIVEGIKESQLTGGAGGNTIDVTGFSGKTTLSGGAGNDTLSGGTKDDLLLGGEGDDFLNARNGADTLDAGLGDDTLFGGAGPDWLQGNAGNDLLDGQGGSLDTVLGGAGDDTLIGGSGSDLLQGGDGNDFLQGGDGDDTLQGGAENDILLGQEGDDVLHGDADRDLLIGGPGADKVNGGSRGDILIGGTTDFDDDLFGLNAVLTVWAGGPRYTERVAALGDHNNSSYYLQSGYTVRDDAVSDVLRGNNGLDWFFRPGADGSPTFDDPNDIASGEKLDTLTAMTGVPGRNQVVWPHSVLREPDYLQPINDPVFGTQITRISGDAGTALSTVYNTGGPAEATWSSTIRNRYVTDSPWNIDGSLIHLRSYDLKDPYQLVLNAGTYQPEFIAVLPNTNFRWSQDPSRPNIQYSLVTRLDSANEDDLIYEYDVTTGVTLRITTLPFNKLYSGKETIAFVNGKQYVALLGVDKADPQSGIQTYVVNLDYIEGQESPVVASFNLSDANCGHAGPCGAVNTNTLTFSPDGKHILVMYDGLTPADSSWRLLDVDIAAAQITPHVMPSTPTTTPTGPQGDPQLGHFPVNWSHPTFAYGADGQTVYLVGSSGSWQGRTIDGVETLTGRVGGLLAFNTATNTYTSLTNPDNEATVSHVTATNFDTPGYVFAAYSSVDGGTKYRGELVAVRLEDPNNPNDGLIRLAHHRTNAANGLWQSQAHLVVSRDASQLIFSSTWGESQDSVSTYLIDLQLPTP